MYKSPIELIENTSSKLIKEQEKILMETVVSYGFDVDKEELFRALQYDRQQYLKGYNDGVNFVKEKLKEFLL